MFFDLTKMKTDYTKQDIIPNVFFVILTIAVVAMFVNQIFVSGYKQAWNASEWLINYQGGFVRRGLRGEIIFQLFNRFHLDPFTAIQAITGFSLVALFVFFFKRFISKGYPILLIPSILLLGNPIINKFWIRPDCILCLLFVAIVYLIHKKPTLYILWINVFTIIGLLIHEIFIFIFVPITVLLLFEELKSKSAPYTILKVSLSLLPSTICFFLVFLFNGSEEIVSKVWQSWGDEPFSIDFTGIFFDTPYPGALTAITSNLKEGLILSSEGLTFFSDHLYAPIMVLLMIAAIYFVFVNINKLNFKILKFKPRNDHNGLLISTVLGLQFLVTIPLYVIGYDYGRWTFFWVVSSFIILLIIPEKKLFSVIPSFFVSYSSRVMNAFQQLSGNSRAVVFLISTLVCFSITFWYLYDIRGSSLYIVLSSISSCIAKLMSIFIS